MPDGLTEYPAGLKEWHLNGKFHREDGPAIEYPSGTKKYYQFGILHREDGPARMYLDGKFEWWLAGKPITILSSSSSSYDFLKKYELPDIFYKKHYKI